jgi:hypothetical protein
VLRNAVTSMHRNVGAARGRWSAVVTLYTEDEVAELLRVPVEITERLTDLHVMEDAGVAIQRAILAVDAARTAVYTQYAFWRHGGVWHDPQTNEEHPLEEPEDVDEAFLEASNATRTAVDAIELLLR